MLASVFLIRTFVNNSQADLRLFKRTILPNISKAITKLQESLPKVGREKMEEFSEEYKVLKEMIDFEPKSTEDYVGNMDIVERMNEKFDILESKLMSIDNVYAIMREIPIPISSDDKNSLKGLKASMNTLAQKIQERIKLQADVLPLFRKQLEGEEKVLKETIHEAFKDVKSSNLLEAEASIEEIKPVLNKIEILLVQSRERVLRYNDYEKRYGFSFSEYFELVAAEKTLTALKTLWRCIESWEKMYEEWSTIIFDTLDVNKCEEKTSKIKQEIVLSQEILGESPVSQDLNEKVTTMLDNLPCLKDLKAKSLKERHWKMISEIIGSEIKSHKITLGFLEQNNVFSYAQQVVSIVRTAEMEEQLDELVDNLKKSWTEKRLEMTPKHGVPCVKDFVPLYETVSQSILTLQQLGSSQYSTEMREQLIDWYKTVENARESLNVIKMTQEKFLLLDLPLNSLVVEEELPIVFQQFSSNRRKLLETFVTMSEKPSLISAFGDNDLINGLKDINKSLEESEDSLPNVLWAIRISSPWLFFLSDSELLRMMSKSYQDIKTTEVYLSKIFPWFNSMLTVPGTDTEVTRRVSHLSSTGDVSRFYKICFLISGLQS